MTFCEPDPHSGKWEMDGKDFASHGVTPANSIFPGLFVSDPQPRTVVTEVGRFTFEFLQGIYLVLENRTWYQY